MSRPGDPVLFELLGKLQAAWFRCDAKGRLLEVRGGWQDISGSSPETLVGRGLTELLPGVTADDLGRWLRHGEATQVRLRRGDGCLVRCRLGLSELADGSITGVLQDVDDWQSAKLRAAYQGAFREAVTQLSSEFVQLPSARIDEGVQKALGQLGRLGEVDRCYVFLFSEDLRVLSNTHEWCALGIQPQIQELQVLSADLFDYAVERFRRFETLHIPRVSELPAEARALQGVLEEGEIQSVLCVPMSFNERLVGFIGFDAVRTCKIWSDDDIALLRIVGEIFTNALERKRARAERRVLERKFMEAQKLESLGVLAGGIAHDFNNLLTPILGHASLALLDLPEDSPAAEEIAGIEIAAKRAADLVSQLLAYAGRSESQKTAQSPNELIHQMADLLRVSISKKIELQLHLTTDVGSVFVDAGQIQQVLLNLITNAADAIGDKNGVIEFRSTRVVLRQEDLPELAGERDLEAGPYVCLEVRDTGCGMESETRRRIFEPFYSTKEKGHGLGLAAILGIVKAHGGAIRVESEPGVGSQFFVYLPPSGLAEPEVETEPSAQVSLDLQGEVLISDDDPGVRDLVSRVLSRCGLNPMMAQDGVEALERFQSHGGPLALVVLDMGMPRLNGAEVLAQIRQQSAEIPAILMSGGESTEQTLADAEPAGSHVFLHKPFTASQLRDAVRQALAPPSEL